MLLLKSAHIACAVLWLGNFAITGIWSLRAFLSRDPALRRFAVREILFTDAVFTLVFGSAVVATGIGLASMESVPVLRTAWTQIALAAVVASGVVWLAALLPLEIAMYRAAHARPPRDFSRAFAAWNAIGWAVTLLLFAVIFIMVRKPV